MDDKSKELMKLITEFAGIIGELRYQMSLTPLPNLDELIAKGYDAYRAASNVTVECFTGLCQEIESQLDDREMVLYVRRQRDRLCDLMSMLTNEWMRADTVYGEMRRRAEFDHSLVQMFGAPVDPVKKLLDLALEAELDMPQEDEND